MDFILLLGITWLIIQTRPIDAVYLTPKYTTALKGLLAIGIIFHHLSQNLLAAERFNNYNFANFEYLGFYIVALFFFLSGFGLAYQELHKNHYLHHFFSRKILPFITKVAFVAIVYLGLRKIVFHESFWDLLKSFLHRSTIISNGWFLQVIILMYLFFYFAYSFFKNRKSSLLLMLFLSINFIIVAIKLGYGFWWYNNCLAFTFGLAVATYQDSLKALTTKYEKIILPSLVILLFFGHNQRWWVAFTPGSFSYALAINMVAIVFVAFFLLIWKRMAITTPFLNYLGKISLELYMVHGFFLALFHYFMRESFTKEIIGTTSLFILSVICASVLAKFFQYIEQSIKQN